MCLDLQNSAEAARIDPQTSEDLRHTNHEHCTRRLFASFNKGLLKKKKTPELGMPLIELISTRNATYAKNRHLPSVNC
jgi:hypothetical protein